MNLHRLTIPLVLLFSSCCFSLQAQDSLFNQLKTEICLKLSKEPKITSASYRQLFEQSISQHRDSFLEECLRKFSDSSQAQQEKYTEYLFDSLSVQLVYSCRPYFLFIDEVRYDGILGLNKDSIAKLINNMNSTFSDSWTQSNYTKRGILFLQVAKLDFALQDFEEALLIDPLSIQAMYGKAWVLELKKRYDEAYDLYLKLSMLTRNNMYKIFAAAVERKKRNK